jgi:C1A family cysteine protease
MHIEQAMNRKYNLSLKRSDRPKTLLPLEKSIEPLPAVVDLRSKMPPVYDQGSLGSCTANALCAAVQYEDLAIQGSRLFVYYNERVMENSVTEDAGAIIGDGVQTLCKFGVCQEASWPYDISKFAEKPPQACYDEAVKHKVLKDYALNNDEHQMKKALAAGFPFVLGIAIFSSFESEHVARTGVVPMPKPSDKNLGGHAIMCVGYDDHKREWIMRNSWSANWGDKGYFYLPYKYLLDPELTSDMWVITSVMPSV